jgi:eukaryotic-like serine/threonine-protein kinase
MLLAAGTLIGPYEIVAPIGAGGMGEVYRARDPRLGRELAIKVLPVGLATDADRLHRFEQEARSASALNHPNIITIYDIGRVDSVSYIAMELVSGGTLRDTLAEGPLPMRKLLSLAAQIADGVARAHDAGIVHRDLKPDNVMVTRDGTAKILDFGLAKLLTLPTSSVQDVTVSARTHPGLVLGTMGYMSPEQASGRPVDWRSDQFSFGALLYELVTSKRPFSRHTSAETLAAIIREEPEPIQTLAPHVPNALRWIIERCLAKDPDERYASTRDLARDLAHLRDHASEISAAAGNDTRPARRQLSLLAVAGWSVAAVAIAIAFASTRKSPLPPAPMMRFSVPLPDGVTYAPADVSRGFSVSPDGTKLVVEAYAQTRRHLYLRSLDSDEFVRLEGTEDATAHFWSPDGRYLAFFAGGKLKKVPSTGGRPQEICTATFALVGSWSAAGDILFSNIAPPGIFRVADRGGTPVRVAAPEPARNDRNLNWPQFLPDGRRFLYVAGKGAGRGGQELRLGTLDADNVGNPVIAQGRSRVEYIPQGFLIFARDGALFSQPFDEKAGSLRGEPRQLAPSVHFFFGPSLGVFAASKNGVIAYQVPAPPSRIEWFTYDGREAGPLGDPVSVRGIRISPDGSRVAVAVRDNHVGSADVWVVEPSSGVKTRLHSDSVDETIPVWSRDGSTLVYRSDRLTAPDIYQMALAASGGEKTLLEQPGVQQPEDISRDGRLAYVSEVATTVWNIYLFSMDAKEPPKPWAPTRFNQTSPRFSPNGRWIAYESDESETPAIYVALTDGGGQKRRISPTEGMRPRWRADGTELYYMTSDGSIMAVPVTPGPEWKAGPPRRLFRVDRQMEDFDVMPDASRFLIVTTQEKVRESPLRVILNATTALTNEK